MWGCRVLKAEEKSANRLTSTVRKEKEMGGSLGLRFDLMSASWV